MIKNSIVYMSKCEWGQIDTALLRPPDQSLLTESRLWAMEGDNQTVASRWYCNLAPHPTTLSHLLRIMMTPASHDIMSWVHCVLKLMIVMKDWGDLMKEFKVDGDDLIEEHDLLVERELIDEVFILDCS